jgi:hypothetical protein
MDPTSMFATLGARTTVVTYSQETVWVDGDPGGSWEHFNGAWRYGRYETIQVESTSTWPSF